MSLSMEYLHRIPTWKHYYPTKNILKHIFNHKNICLSFGIPRTEAKHSTTQPTKKPTVARKSNLIQQPGQFAEANFAKPCYDKKERICNTCIAIKFLQRWTERASWADNNVGDDTHRWQVLKSCWNWHTYDGTYWALWIASLPIRDELIQQNFPISNPCWGVCQPSVTIIIMHHSNTMLTGAKRRKIVHFPARDHRLLESHKSKSWAWH